jgi:transcription elongation factor GreB
MSKAFTRESDAPADDEDDDPSLPPLPAGTRNYMTPAGYRRLREELMTLLDVERPKVVEAVSWAAKNGDRSENGDYLYGKKRLREIDRRIRFLTRRLDRAEVVDPQRQAGNDQVFFGATVAYRQSDGVQRRVTIVGIDEVDPVRGRISWVSPVARALIKAREGDTVALATPAGRIELEIVEVRYGALE